MKTLFKFILFLLLPFVVPKLSFGQTGVQYVGTKDNVLVTRNIARADSAQEFPLTDTSKHPVRPGRLTSFNGSPYWWNGRFWFKINGDTSTFPGQVNSDWNATTGVAFIQNKPVFAPVATSGSYSDLLNKPTIPAAQVAVDWNAASGITHILNKPRITDSIWRVIGKDSILFRIIGPDGVVRNYSILDSAGGTGGGGGSLTNFASGNLTPLFTTNVVNPTSSPAQAFTLSNAAGHTYFGNGTGSTGPPSYTAIGLGDLPPIPASSTLFTFGYGLTLNTNALKVDSTVIGYPRFSQVFRPGGTDSIYYQTKTNASTFVNTFAFMDSVRVSAKGAAGAIGLTFQTAPSSFFSRKVAPGTNTAFTIASDSTLTIASTLTQVINALQVVNNGAAKSIQVGTFASRPAGTTGDIYIASDSSYRESYFNGTAWIWMTVSPKQLSDSLALKDTVHIAHIAPIGNLFASGAGTTIFDVGSRAGWGMIITKLSDSSNQYMVDSAAIKNLAGFGGGSGGGISSVFTQNSITGNGLNNSKIQLVNDSAAAANYVYYRNSVNRLGWYPFSTMPVATAQNPGLESTSDFIAIHSKITFVNVPVGTYAGDSLAYASATLDTFYQKRLNIGYGILKTVTQGNISFQVDTTTLKNIFGSGSATGTVRSFTSGNLSPLFTTGVTSSTLNPSQTFTLSNAGAWMLFGNGTGSTAAPNYFAPVLASGLFANQGTTTALLHGNASGNPSWSAVNLTTDVTGTLPATSGGTSQNTYVLGDMLYSSATNTLSKLAGNITTTRKVLAQTGNGSVSAAPAWTILANTDIGLGNVQNINVTTWPGSTNLTTLGTITTAVWQGTPVDAAHGGTGMSSYVIGDVITATSNNTLGVTSDIAVGNVLRSGGVGALPAYGKVNLSTDVTSNLPVSNLNGGVGATSTTVWTGNGTWQPFNTTLYSGDGSLAGNRIVTMASNSLTFTGGSKITMNQTLQVADGTQGVNKWFESDINGNGTWQPLPANIYTGDGNLASDRTVSGFNSHGAPFKMTFDNVNGFVVNSVNGIILNGFVQFNEASVADADYTVGSIEHFLNLPVTSSGHIITLPTGTSGRVLTIRNPSGSAWTFSGGSVMLTAGSNATSTTLASHTIVRLVYDSSLTAWLAL